MTRARFAVVLTLAVAFSFLTISTAQADPLTAGQAGKYMNNSLKAAALPVWKITQDGTVNSVPWVDHAPNPRFAIYDPGTPGDQTDDVVLDKETGLVWTRDANLLEDGPLKNWLDAMVFARQLNNDSSNVGKRQGWRLPTVEELGSLVDKTESLPSLPSGHPFINALNSHYWSSTTFEGDSTYAWDVVMIQGNVYYYPKTDAAYVWPVRGGNGYATGSW